MGRSRHHIMPPLNGSPTDRQCEQIASLSGMPLNVIRFVLCDGWSVTPATAKRIRDVLDRSDRPRVSSKIAKKAITVSEKSRRDGRPPHGYEGPFVIPVEKIEKDMLLMVSDRLVSGWIRVTEAPVKSTMRKNELVILTESGNVLSNNTLSVRVAVHVDSDSQ